MSKELTTRSKRFRILHRLVEGPASTEDLGAVIRGPTQTEAGAVTRARNLLAVLQGDKLVERDPAGWRITRAGLSIYHGASTSVRIFRKEPAHA